MATQALQEKFADYSAALNSRLVEREEEIEIFLLALVAKTHAFFLGEPGIAKSLLVESGVQLIDGLSADDYFHILMMKGTTPEHVFGPLDLPKLKQGRYYFIPEGYLPMAKIAFLDEFWKANAAIQNALLLATNEREYRNDGKIVELPLHSMFIASNEMPPSDELAAIYDRFPLRVEVKRVIETTNFIKMLGLASKGKATTAPVLTWDDIELAHTESQAVVIPDAVHEELANLREKLDAEGIKPSDRRFVQFLDIVKAHTWLSGETEAEVENLRPGRHVFWTNPEDFPAVDKLLTNLVNPLDLEIRKIGDELSQLGREIEILKGDDVDEVQRARAGSQIFDKIGAAKEELKGLHKQLNGSKKRSKEMSKVTRQMRGLINTLLVDIFKTTPEEVEEGVDDFADFDQEDTGDDNE